MAEHELSREERRNSVWNDDLWCANADLPEAGWGKDDETSSRVKIGLKRWQEARDALDPQLREEEKSSGSNKEWS